MNETEFISAPSPRRPRTVTVLGLLASAAAVLSYLGTYAMSNALVAADVLKPWPADSDPRPHWFWSTFLVLILLFLAVASLARFTLARHFRQFERMENDELGGG